MFLTFVQVLTSVLDSCTKSKPSQLRGLFEAGPTASAYLKCSEIQKTSVFPGANMQAFAWGISFHLADVQPHFDLVGMAGLTSYCELASTLHVDHDFNFWKVCICGATSSSFIAVKKTENNVLEETATQLSCFPRWKNHQMRSWRSSGLTSTLAARVWLFT